MWEEKASGTDIRVTENNEYKDNSAGNSAKRRCDGSANDGETEEASNGDPEGKTYVMAQGIDEMTMTTKWVVCRARGSPSLAEQQL